MKTKPLMLWFSLLCSGVFSIQAAQAALEVHEWGTFTVLLGADGSTQRWYLPAEDQFQLPAFVHRRNLLWQKALADGRALARMETPVIYFYPDQEMYVAVKAVLPSGSLSEWFPDALKQEPLTARMNPQGLQWVGRLLPPGSPLAEVIPTTADAAGQHYGEARKVPEAWLFQSGLPVANGKAAEIDRILFYRGAADLTMPVFVKALADDKLELQNSGPTGINTLYAVQASGDRLAWSRLEGLDPQEFVEGRNLSTMTFTFSQAGSRETEMTALRRDMEQSIVREGLTTAEAAAMVATWRDIWFGEIGTRVFAVLPTAWVDEKVPLQISPTPGKTVRVYVARLEILTPGREQGLVDLLSGKEQAETAAARLKALELGRFTEGALGRAQQLQSAYLANRLRELKAFK